ncbi:MAG TPA: MATE family efflux transporter [Oligoflexus sp.]|uniref:MATE family efflux transporter n=1 Tax=Oligoflexus sp. TaxID=1971216 RepID=UPI002D61FF48|nr:MATE family efflux transporter [Oligoflexus sp.]HYX32338.1 MATE family efflux transporter [Oligoflexus sp.]
MSSVPIRDRSLFSLSGPVLFELLMLYMVPAVDAYYMTRVSPEAVAGVSAVLPITGVGFILFTPLTQAGSSVAAQHLGANNIRMAGLTFTALLALNIILGLVVSFIFVSLAPFLPAFVGLHGEFATLAAAYIRALGFGYVFLALKVTSSGILNALGRTQINMWAAVLMNVINLALNHLLVTGPWGLPKFGVAGVAMASATAWLMAFLMAMFFCYRHLAKVPTFLQAWPQVRETIGHVLRIGLPSTLEPLSYQLSQVVISRILVSLGVLAITTKAYVANVTLFSLLWGAAFASGTQIKVAWLLGERSYQAATQQLITGVKIALIGCTFLSLALALGGPWLLQIFTSDPDVLRLGSRVLWVAIFLEWGRALNVIVGAALRASGDARFVAIFALASMWLLAVLGSYLIGVEAGLGLIGIWIVMGLDEHLRGWVSLKRWMSGRWQSKTIYR